MCDVSRRGGPYSTAQRCCSIATPIGAARLTAAALCQTVAALQPGGAIIVDEALTSGNAYWDASMVTRAPQLSI